MSQENVEIVRRGYESWNRDDMEAGLRDLDPEIEWRPRLGTAGVRATVYHPCSSRSRRRQRLPMTATPALSGSRST